MPDNMEIQLIDVESGQTGETSDNILESDKPNSARSYGK